MPFWAASAFLDFWCSSWQSALQQGEDMDLARFVRWMQEKNLRNSVFVDITASDSVAMTYEQLLEKSIAVVACNKVAASSPFDHYKKLEAEVNAVTLDDIKRVAARYFRDQPYVLATVRPPQGTAAAK